MKQCGLIGDPVEHSLSPVMQNAAFRESQVDATYHLWQTDAKDIPSRIESLRDPDVLGANITVPHKQIVLPHCDDLTATARRIGAVNTIVNRSGTLLGDNTDAYGFGATVRGAGVESGRHGTALILGAGGAARAVIVALQQLGFPRILLANRTVERAQRLADELGGGDVLPVDWDSLDEDLPGATMLVNATSLGWHDGEMPMTPSQVARMPRRALVVDLTYRETDLLRAAKVRGIASVDGFDMLVHQGARSFSLWTGLDAPVSVMRRAVQTEQQLRAAR
jgi:shikimate dehydrogenase